MKTTTVFAAALVRLVASQSFDFAAVLNAPAPSVTEPPLGAASAVTSAVNSAAIGSSISAKVVETTASVTGAAASAASTQQPPVSGIEKRWGFDWNFWNPWSPPKTTETTSTDKHPKTTAKSSTDKNTKTTEKSTQKPTEKTSTPPVTSATTTPKQSMTTTTSSTSACPTTPEDGTYCGFINPEDPCAPQPDGYGPKVEPDTVEAFKAYPQFHQEAQNAKTPAGYKQIFEDLYNTVSGNSYITFYTLKSYDTDACAKHCDETDLCTAFNIYVERDPSLNPTKNDTNPEFNCPLPSSITNYKCSLFGSSIDEEAATNEGGYRGDFHVVFAGSNGYDKTNQTTPVTPPKWEQPHKCPGGAISEGGDYHVGGQFYPGPFNPSLCAVYAEAQTAKNKESAKQAGKHSYTPCNMFNAYMVHKNGKGQGTYCSLYDTVLSDSWAKFQGAWSGKDWFGIENSWTYSQKNLDKGEW